MKVDEEKAMDRKTYIVSTNEQFYIFFPDENAFDNQGRINRIRGMYRAFLDTFNAEKGFGVVVKIGNDGRPYYRLFTESYSFAANKKCDRDDKNTAIGFMVNSFKPVSQEDTLDSSVRRVLVTGVLTENICVLGKNRPIDRNGFGKFLAYIERNALSYKHPDREDIVIKRQEAAEKIAEQRKEITREPRNLEEQAISLVGRDIYEKLVKGYTEKQWGRDCRDLPAFIIRRLPVRLTWDNNYFNALYQGIPIGGYTRLVENMLEGIEVQLNRDYLADRDAWNALAEKVIYTGPIDAFFDYSLGHLAYRSVRFETELLDMPSFQGNAAVNYTDRETPWTRIIEHKWFQFGKDDEGNDLPKTIISREYSAEWKPGDEPYYPVNDERNTNLLRAYQDLAGRQQKVIFAGRLGEYKYYDMDQAVAAALAFSRCELNAVRE